MLLQEEDYCVLLCIRCVECEISDVMYVDHRCWLPTGADAALAFKVSLLRWVQGPVDDANRCGLALIKANCKLCQVDCVATWLRGRFRHCGVYTRPAVDMIRGAARRLFWLLNVDANDCIIELKANRFTVWRVIVDSIRAPLASERRRHLRFLYVRLFIIALCASVYEISKCDIRSVRPRNRRGERLKGYKLTCWGLISHRSSY